MAQLGRSQPVPPVISRGSLADPPDLLKRGPVVISGARDRLAFAVTAGQGTPVPAVISAAPLITAAAPAAAAPAPLVITGPAQPPATARLVVTRGALADPADFTGRQPLISARQPPLLTPAAPVISAAPPVTAAAPPPAAPAAVVVTAQPPPAQPAAAVTSRSSLADAPVLTTPVPVVTGPAATPGFGRPGPPLTSSAPFIPAAPPPPAAPAPLVTRQQPPAATPGPAVISRGSLADAPVLTTPAPVVVLATAVTPWGKPQAAVISASPAAPAAAPAVTPQPVIAAQAVKLAAAQPPVILRGSLADPPVLTTPRPVIVAQPVRWPPTFPVISSAPFIPPPPPFTIGTLTAADAPGAVLTAAAAANALTGSTAAQGMLTASDTRTGGPS